MRYKRKHLDATRTRSARREHLKHWGNKCAYCGKKLTLENITLDHFVPLKHGGPKGALNTLPSCKKCNGYKGKAHPARYIQSINDNLTTQQVIDDIMTYFNFRYYLSASKNNSRKNQNSVQAWYNSLWSWMNQFTTVRRIDNAI